MKQYTLLCAALLCAQTEARIVYSTCSINPVENDEVVRRFLKKKKDFVKAASDVFSESTKNALEKSVGLEQTELGWIILPDTQGYGPIYFSAIQKTSWLKFDLGAKLIFKAVVEFVVKVTLKQNFSNGAIRTALDLHLTHLGWDSLKNDKISFCKVHF